MSAASLPQYQSALKHHLGQRGIEWPAGHSKRFLRAIRGAQNLQPKSAVAKHPLVPSMGLQQWVAATGVGAPLKERVGMLFSVLLLFLGWRSCVLASLHVGDLEWVTPRDCAAVRRTDKSLLPDRERPRAYVAFPRVPQLHALLKATISDLRSTLPADTQLFPWYAGNKASTSAVLSNLFRAHFLGAVTSHCARVGCATSLLNIGVSAALVKAHIDWTEGSATWRTYYRPGWPVDNFDIVFYWAALPVCVQRILAQ